MNKKLHILFISSWYPSRVFPTNGDFVQRHAEAVATKHKVTVIHVVTDTDIKSPENFDTITKNVETKLVYLPKSKNQLIKLFHFFKAYLSNIKKIEPIDVVHVNITFPIGLIALYLKWFLHKPYIISEHWSDYQFPLNNSIGFLRKMTTKLILKNATFVCPVTNHLQKAMIDFGLKGNYLSVPNVVNTSIFNIGKINSNKFVVSHISDMDNSIKNISGILNIISKLEQQIPNLEFNLIGGNSKKYLQLIHKLNIKNFNVIDNIPHNEVANYLKKSNVFVLFSNYENLPCVILEAFSCGIPVISTDVGGISEYFPQNFGYLISPKDEATLEKSILKIYDKKIKPNKKVIHNYAENKFGINTISSTFSKIYKQTLNIN
ncbi:glycosyltransferase family 4 protein [Lutibacter sp.]|uniref:glycosyltransferase family 4 protein n=1 Tax=Lutibacter sp. TaxID=1925666 RepID=UPI0025C0BA61|nr:glycosyltransferase family 4 protein [Lutibacter sp.]MCF6181145.1 glycosyltransferase family 4 protein [Lutibacter sp.]